MYSIQDIRRGLKDPQLVKNEMKYWMKNPHQVRSKLYSWYFRNMGHHEGTNFFEEEWDNLVILDACRYDLFEDINTIQGELSPIQSVASQTEEFLKKTVDERKFPDTIYVSANPQITKVDAEFSECIALWDKCWDDDLGTVPPSDVVNEAISIHNKYPNKKLVIHFVQPHMPFIGKTGKQIDHACFQGGVLNTNGNNKKFIWGRLANGEVSQELIWKAYQENLELALSELPQLLSAIDGRTIITSDHGNATGEWGVYGHPPHIHLNALTKVPWLVIEDERRTISEESELISTKEINKSNIGSNLKALGYV